MKVVALASPDPYFSIFLKYWN